MDNFTGTEGTRVNWRMMGTIISHVNRLDNMVDHHDDARLNARNVYGLMHTITTSNMIKNFVVIITNLLLMYLQCCVKLIIACLVLFSCCTSQQHLSHFLTSHLLNQKLPLRLLPDDMEKTGPSSLFLTQMLGSPPTILFPRMMVAPASTPGIYSGLWFLLWRLDRRCS